MSNLVEPRWNSDEPSEYENVAEVEWRDESYEFDMTRVYQHTATGKLFYAEDSGCSCPSPFEDTEISDLLPIVRMQDWYDHVTERTIPSMPTSAVDEAEAARRAIHAILTAQKEAAK